MLKLQQWLSLRDGSIDDDYLLFIFHGFYNTRIISEKEQY